MRAVVSHAVGNANVRAILNGFNDAGILQAFYTTIASFPSGVFYKVSPYIGLGEIKRRSYNNNIRSVTHSYPSRELLRLLSMKLKLGKLFQHETGLFSFDAVNRSLDALVARNLPDCVKAGADTVYGYEDCSFETFTKAKAMGMRCVYDLPIAYWELSRLLLNEESERWPDWKVTLAGGVKDSQEKLDRKTRELELADVVVTPGRFVANSLPAYTAKSKKIITSPFGSPQVTDNHKKYNTNGPLRVLFVGSMSQRKGLADLFESVNRLGSANIELVVMGSLMAPESFYRARCPSFKYEPGRPHDKVLELMRTCDVLCLPSIVEGRALVMQEAMSQGLPLIITENTGGADLVIEGETGFLVPVRSAKSIAEKLELLAREKTLVAKMGRAAFIHSQKYTWNNYVSQIIESLFTRQSN